MGVMMRLVDGEVWEACLSSGSRNRGGKWSKMSYFAINNKAEGDRKVAAITSSRATRAAIWCQEREKEASGQPRTRVQVVGGRVARRVQRCA